MSCPGVLDVRVAGLPLADPLLRSEKFGSVDSEVGMKTSISGSTSISHDTEVKGEIEYQHEEDGRGPRSYPLPGEIKA